MDSVIAQTSFDNLDGGYEPSTYGDADCERCEAPFVRTTQNKRFCSKECLRLYQLDTRKANRPTTDNGPEWHACRGFGCNKVFRKRQHNHRFCSAQCGQKWRAVMRRTTPVLGTCPVCRTEFLPRRSQKYCSKRCWRDDYYDRLRRPKKRCKECGDKFIPGLRKKFCSNDCMTAFDLRRKRANYKKDKQPALDKAAAWREQNREYLRKAAAAYRRTHREELREKAKQYYAENSDDLKAKQRRRYKEKKKRESEAA